MLKAAGSAAALTILGGIPLNAAEAGMTPVPKKNRKKILVIGAHPDDPETSVGGTMCLLADAGHEVVSVYFTRGEAGIPGKSHAEAAAIRSKEAEAACAVMGVRPLFMEQIDGSTDDVMNLGNLRAKYESFGWKVYECDGNDMQEIVDNLNEARENAHQGFAQIILAHTEMGYGVDFMMGTHKWHGTPPNDEQAANALSQLKETLGDY